VRRRREAERIRDPVEAAFGPLDRIEDGRKVQFGCPRAASAISPPPTAEELTELESAARALEAADSGRLVPARFALSRRGSVQLGAG
jgi:hypothetical protein